jgi:hypothetical protein
VHALMKLFSALVLELREKPDTCPEKELPTWVEALFLFSLIWSVAGVIDGDSRPKFDTFLRQMCTGSPPRGYEKCDGVFGEAAPWAKMLPDDASCYEYKRPTAHTVGPPRPLHARTPLTVSTVGPPRPLHARTPLTVSPFTV